jgi:predicted nucleic acid-binding protein
MRVIIDTNIVFSALLNANCKISRIILNPKSKFNFYSSNQLKLELEKHNEKLKVISGLSESEIRKNKLLLFTKIRFINEELIPKNIIKKAIELTKDIDLDDAIFVALAEHSSAKLWTGDKILFDGLTKQGWQKLITINQLHDLN